MREHGRDEQATSEPLGEDGEDVFHGDKGARESEVPIGESVCVGMRIINGSDDRLQEAKEPPDDEGRPGDDEDAEGRIDSCGFWAVLRVNSPVVRFDAEEPGPGAGEGACGRAILTEGEVEEDGEHEVDV